jgi:hypothetical protein
MTMQVEEVLAPIPDDQRVSTASYQFWIWCGANIAPINWILGTLGIAFWGMSMTEVIHRDRQFLPAVVRSCSPRP